MERVKVGTVIRKDLLDQLKSAAVRNRVPLSDLMEEGIILMLRREAVRQFQEIATRREQAPGTAERVLKESRRDLEQRGPQLPARRKRQRRTVRDRQ